MAASDAITCNLQTLNLTEILTGILTVDAAGCKAIRYMTAADSGVQGFDCNTILHIDSEEALTQVLREALGVDLNGNLAIRLALTTP